MLFGDQMVIIKSNFYLSPTAYYGGRLYRQYFAHFRKFSNYVCVSGMGAPPRPAGKRAAPPRKKQVLPRPAPRELEKQIFPKPIPIP